VGRTFTKASDVPLRHCCILVFMKSIMIRIDMIIHKPLKIEAEKDGQSIQLWVSNLIREELKKRKRESREE
jgi:predicted HicB family RNase H-like nuclease